MIMILQGMCIRINTFKPISFVKKRTATVYNDKNYYTEATLSVCKKSIQKETEKSVFFLNAHVSCAENCVSIVPFWLTAVFEKQICWSVHTSIYRLFSQPITNWSSETAIQKRPPRKFLKIFTIFQGRWWNCGSIISYGDIMVPIGYKAKSIWGYLGLGGVR